MARTVYQVLESYNASLEEFEQVATEMFTEYLPVWDKVLMGGMTKKAQRSQRIKYVRYVNGPGTARQYSPGGVLPTGRRDISVVGYHNSPVIIDYAWTLDGAQIQFDLDTAEVKVLLAGSETAALAELYASLCEQFVMGAVPGFANIMPLNGDVTYDPGDGDTPTGMLQFAASSGQTGVFAGLTRAGGAGGVANHYNVYRSVSNYSVDGPRKVIEAYMECIRFGWQHHAAPELALADGASWLNMWRNAYERFVPTEFKTDGDMPKYGRMAIPIGGVGIPCYYEPSIDIAAFNSGAGRDGVVMMLNPKSLCHIALPGQQYIAKGATKNKFFTHAPLEKLSDGSRNYQTCLTWFGQFSAEDLRTNAVLEGTATY